MTDKRFPRYAEREIAECLETSAAVRIAGPKWCGKTTLGRLFAKSEYILDSRQAIQIAKTDPYSVLQGSTPRLMDEWQYAPEIWDAVRNEADRRDEKTGQFILTGSSTPEDKTETLHSGAGRIVTLTVDPLTLFETGESSGAVSLASLFAGETFSFKEGNGATLRDVAFWICRGGWPVSCLLSDRTKALRTTRNYCSTIFDFEHSPNKKFRNKKKTIFEMIMRAYARNVSTEVRRTTLIGDIEKRDDRKLDPDTFDEYLEALEDLYIVRDLEAHNLNLRSKASAITTPTRHFVDTSLVAYALRCGPDELMEDGNTLGFLFEDFVVKEMGVYARALGGGLSHYRDSEGLEADLIMTLNNAKYALIEVKLGYEDGIKEGAKNLLKLKKLLVDSGEREPSFLLIVTAVGNAYRREDGVYVAPISAISAKGNSF